MLKHLIEAAHGPLPMALKHLIAGDDPGFMAALIVLTKRVLVIGAISWLIVSAVVLVVKVWEWCKPRVNEAISS